MKKKNVKKIKALTAAVDEFNDNGIYLAAETERKLNDRLDFLSGLHEPIRLEGCVISDVVVDTYFRRRSVKSSAIIFQFHGSNHPGTSMIVIPNARAEKRDIFCLVEDIRKIAEFDYIIIDDPDCKSPPNLKQEKYNGDPPF